MAVTASFIATTGVLTVFGDALDNNITISRNAAGDILVNGGAVAIQGGTPTVANTTLIQTFGQGLNDSLVLDETNGALPHVNHFGSSDNDSLTGGSGGDMLFGQSGNDALLGKGGFDFLFGGADNDTLTGGDGDDQVFGESGNDRMIWNPGDDTDLFEGGADDDTAEVNGGGGAEVFTVTANGARVRFDRLDAAPFALDIGTTENLVVNMNGGDDQFSATGNLSALIKITVDGGAGNDTILGSNGIDLLIGGEGNDFIDGQQGNDVAFLGASDDTFQWDPGDGSDTVEGQAGADRLLFNGSAGAELFQVSANGGRALFTRNLGNIVMDLDDVETIELNVLGNTDTLTVNDLTGTDIKTVKANLSGTLGGTAGDGQADTVIVNATNGNDAQITIGGGGASVAVTGLAAQVTITGAEGANDVLVVNALGGNDTINASTLPAGVVKLTIDGGAGDDTINGSQGADVFLGGDGNDIITGDNGNDVALMGANNDTFVWNPGDGNDTVEGQDGSDTLDVNGSSASENIDIVANGGRVIFFRDVANVTMDLDGVETIDFDTLGGADNIVVGDLSGTDVTQINVDLAGTPGGTAGDGAADTVTVNATNGNDAQIKIASNAAGTLTVDGLPAKVVIEHGEAASDRLTINALGGDDTIDASAVAAGQVKLTLNGGLGKDVLIGSGGGDAFNGGDGDDTALMGGGNDTFVWNPGDDNDTLEGEAGTDTMLFNGSAAAEQIDIAANNGRVRFFRDIAAVTMDLDDVEAIDFTAGGGADLITVNDLSGTDVKKVALDLGVGGAGDGQADTVTIQGTNGNDTITLSMQGTNRLVIDGLATQIVIDNFEIDNDRVQINGLTGDDVIDASGLNGNNPQLVFDGGDGNDTLIGGADADTLIGGAGDDVLAGNGGVDVLDGGAGDNVVLQGGPALASGGTVAVFGNDLGNTLTVGRNAAGAIIANAGAIPLPGAPTVANTGVIQVFGKDGNDVLALDETSGALPRADLFGGAGNDVATGGAGNDQLFGESGNDTLLGKGGFDFLFGGDGNDTLTGGDADDHVFGGAGDDRMIWNTGDDTDLNEGGAGNDTTEVNGGGGTEVFTATANGTRVRFDRLDPAPFSLDIGTTENLVLNMNGGDDQFSATGNLAALIKITVDGGGGNDSIRGGNGTDLLLGGDGNDFIDGQQGNDVAFLGAGNDTFQWDPGDGSDTVEGQAGTDKLDVNGSNGNENIDISANGGRVRFFRDIANITMDLDDVEVIGFKALGGTDNIVVNDLSTTDVREVAIDLAGVLGGSAGDAQSDQITISAGEGNNRITVGAAGVNPKAADLLVTIDHADAGDKLTILGGGGNDTIDVSQVLGPLALTLSGGTGNDVYIVRGAGDLVIEANSAGADRVFAGVSYTLAVGQSIETLSTLSDVGTGAINLAGNEIVNVLIGNDGVNRLDGRGAADVMAGYGGNDWYFVDVAGDKVVFEGASDGIDRVFAGVSYTLAATQRIETLSTLSDVSTTAINLTGNEFANTLIANAGANVLNGGTGADVLASYGGNDIFLFNTAIGPSNIDTLYDFVVANDTVHLENAIFTQLTTPSGNTLSAGQFFTGAAAHDADDRIIYNSGTGALFYDSDGDGAAAAIQFAKAGTGLGLTSADFFVV